MRKLFTLMLALAMFATASFAQSQRKHIPNVKIGASEKKVVSTYTIKSTDAIYLNEDFETGAMPAGWSEQVSGYSWSFGSDLTSQYWSIPAHTSYVAAQDDAEGSSGDGSDMWLISPAIDLSASATPVVNFAYYHDTQYGGVATLKVSIDGGSNFTDVADIPGNSGWEVVTIAIPSAANQSNVVIAFHYTDEGGWMNGIALDDVLVKDMDAYDVTATAVSSPVNSSCSLNASENITVELENLGALDATGFSVFYSINGGAPVTETYSGTLASGATDSYTFSTAGNFSTVGYFDVTAWVVLASDGNTNNDTASTMVVNADDMITLHLTPDAYPEEVYLGLFNSAGDLVWIGGEPLGIDLGLTQGVETTIDLCAASSDCYTLFIGDSYGDGGCDVTVDYNGTAGQSVGMADYSDNTSIMSIGTGCPDEDVALSDITTPATVGVGNVNISGIAYNLGTNPLTSFDVVYSFDGGAASAVFNVTGINVTTGNSYEFTHNVPWSATLGSHNVVITLSNPNGTTDGNLSNNEGDKDIFVVNEVYPKAVVYEEGTGTWCGWCVRGLVGLNTMAHNYTDGSWIGIAVHNGDPMVVTEYDNAIGTYIGGYPSGIMDRNPSEVDPGLTSLEPAYMEHLDMVPLAKVEIAAQSWDAGTRVISIDLEATFGTDIASADFNLAAIIVEDGVTGTTSGYNQTNYYAAGQSGASIPLVDWDGTDYNSLPSSIPAASMVYNHVGRALLGGWAGASGSIPASVTYNTPYAYTFNHTLAADQDEENIKLVGIIIDNATGEIVNAIEEELSTSIGVKQVNNTNVRIYPNPTTGLVQISGVDGAQIEVYNMVGQVVYTVDNATGKTSIDLSSLVNGNYIVKVINADQVTTQKIVLNK
ncbi:MAG: T9SS type A sorting domain-containing protein [Bacteroidales bacterium]|nr:T9SS type A sorting domain-containing protein [Bacteroidales bacterium]